MIGRVSIDAVKCGLEAATNASIWGAVIRLFGNRSRQPRIRFRHGSRIDSGTLGSCDFRFSTKTSRRIALVRELSREVIQNGDAERIDVIGRAEFMAKHLGGHVG